MDGRAIDSAIERPGGPLAPEDQVIGRLRAHVPAMAGAFVALPDGSEDGFLPDTAGATGLAEGTPLALRVTRGAQGGKGPRLARLDAATAEGPPRLLAHGPGAIERLAALHPEAAIRVDHPAVAAALPPVLRGRAQVGLGDQAAQAAEIWAALAETEVRLPGGGRFSITPTPALVAIDLDAGSLTGERRGKKDMLVALNRRLIPAVARHIRLRHLSGAIVVDAAGLAQRQRPLLADAFRDALAADPLAPRFLGFTALGLAEIQRSRIQPPLHALLSGAEAEALAALAALADLVLARPGEAHSLALAPSLLGAVEADRVARDQFRDRTGLPPALRIDHDLGETKRPWRLVTFV